jgi:hypothetical protein
VSPRFDTEKPPQVVLAGNEVHLLLRLSVGVKPPGVKSQCQRNGLVVATYRARRRWRKARKSGIV